MIPFRTQRLATSVVNRILNVRDGINPQPAAGAPAAPNTVLQEQELAARVGAPKPAVDAAPETAEAIALAPLAQ